MTAKKSFDHPSLGPCEIVPALIAIRWKDARSGSQIDQTLKGHALRRAGEETDAQGDKATGARDPSVGRVNQSSMLTWASVSGEIDSAIEALSGDGNVEWATAVYRARSSETGPRSFFAVDPTCLLLANSAVEAIDDIAAIDVSARRDSARSKLLKGYVVLYLPERNALEIAEKVGAGLGKVPAGAIKLENIPYLSPVTGCACGGSVSAQGEGACSDCAPAISEVIPDDPLFANQWGLQRINAPRAWAMSEGDPNIVIAVLDTGVELLHPDLNLHPVSYSTITHTNNGGPVDNHGTACAGIISGRIENSAGVAGLAGHCRVMAIATLFSDVQVAEGLYFAADNGARVVSMSFGVYPSWGIWDFSIIQASLSYAQSRNVVLVAATGNENQTVSRFPATDPTTIGVGGTNRSDVRKAVGDTSIESFWGACYGPDVDVTAPCLEIPTTDRLGGAGYTPGDYDLRFNGTSSATPHVAALAGLVLSVNPDLSNVEVRQIISETADKVNQPAYVYVPAAGKPFGAWNNEVGYGRINAERALLVACASKSRSAGIGPCAVSPRNPEKCCVSPCDPAWRPDEQCMFWYETRFFRAPLVRGDNVAGAVNAIGRDLTALRDYIEFRITYQHQFCLLGKQHGPLLFTQTLLPGEKVTLYHSERYRRISSESDRFSVQTTFFQFLSSVHQARLTSSVDALADKLTNIKGTTSVSVGGGLAGLLGLPSGGSSVQTNLTDHTMLQVGVVADTFNQSVMQSSQLVHAERSVTVSTYEEKDVADITRRTIQNDNECRAVTYFIRKVVELYAVSTRVFEISYRIIAPNYPPDWHSASDLANLPAAIRDEIQLLLRLLPRVGTVIEQPRPVSLPTDGTVYDPELAHCCSCEPERAAAIELRLKKQNAEALKACLEVQLLEAELKRRSLLLQKGDLTPFEPVSTPAPGSVSG